MYNKRVVITGIGVISSNGVGREHFSEALFKGSSGIRPISLFDTAFSKVKLAAEVKDFRAEEFLGAKGLRTLDRSTKLVASSTKLALDDAGLEISNENTHRCGVSIGTALGSVHSISDFHREFIQEGVRYVNPALFPNTVINSPASQVSIKFNIKGLNATVSTGFCASLDAINYAVDFLKLGRLDVALAGGVEELCVQTFLGFYKTKFLAGTRDGCPEISCPFDKRRNGIILGEGACILVLEELESALKRKARIYAEILGFGMGFDAHRIYKYDPRGQGLRAAMRMAIRDAGIRAEDIGCILAAANSTPEADLIETEAIRDVFGSHAQELYVSSIKSMVGECFSASGSLQAAAAVAAIDKQMAPPTVNYEEKDEGCDLNYVANEAKSCKIGNVLINAFGPNGSNSSLIISKLDI